MRRICAQRLVVQLQTGTSNHFCAEMEHLEEVWHFDNASGVRWKSSTLVQGPHIEPENLTDWCNCQSNEITGQSWHPIGNSGAGCARGSR